MRDYGDVITARHHLIHSGSNFYTDRSVLFAEQKTIPVLIHLCWKRFHLSHIVYKNATDLLDEQVRRNNSAHGRVINSLPVRWTWGINETANLIHRFGARIDQIESQLEVCRQLVDFQTSSAYESLARSWLRKSRHLRARMEMFLQSMMWIQWTIESFEQASEIAYHLRNEQTGQLNSFDRGAFSYIAYQPLFSGIMSIAALLEELGADVIQALTSEDTPENTQLHWVIDKLDSTGIIPENINPGHIDEDVADVEAGPTIRSIRNDLAHSVTARDSVLSLSEFEDYFEVISTGVSLARTLAERLVEDVLVTLAELDLIPE